MANIIQKWKARKRIPKKAYKLVDSINHRYTKMNLDNGYFKELSEKGRLSKLIGIIDNDDEISKLNSLFYIGSIDVKRQERGPGIYVGSGSGLNLCIGNDGLFIYDWDDFANKHNEIPATPDSLEKHLGEIGVEELRNAVVNYSDRRNYVGRVADFSGFVPLKKDL